MKVGDMVYAKNPKMAGMSDEPGIIVDRQKLYKIGFRYQVLFPDVGLKWIKFSNNLIRLEDMWSENECR